VLIFFCEAVELIIIYIKTQAVVRLNNKKDRRGKGKAVKHNKPFVKVF
jgi:hypothetical protein